MSAAVIDAALAFAAKGRPVFPCSPTDKRPLTPHGHKDASTDPVQIRTWWTIWPAAMIGMPTGKSSGVFVVDIDYDPDKSVDGFGTLAELETKHGPLPDTRTSITPRGGTHLFFKWCDGVANSAGKLGKYLDVRGEGGYVILPPSMRSDHIRYRWRAKCPVEPVLPPDWLIALATAPKNKSNGTTDHSSNATHSQTADAYGRAALDDECAAVAGAAEGGRNHQLNRSAFSLSQLVNRGDLDEDEVRARLLSAALVAGLAEAEAERTINSGFAGGEKKPRKPEGKSQGERKRTDDTKEADAGHTAGQDDTGTKSSKQFQWHTAQTVEGPMLAGNWLIKGILPLHGLGVIYGKPGRGKSVLTTDIALHIANGLPWRGTTTVRAGVSYLGSEAGRLGVNRVLAWCRHYGHAWPEKFRLSVLTLDLRSSQKDALALAADIKASQPDCGLVVVDTLARNMAGGNENASEDMGAYIANVARLEQLTGAFVLSVHHSGKDEARGSRGHSSLLGAIDFEAEIKREQGEPGLMRISKLRDGQDGAEYGFDISAVELGFDEDGEPVTAPIAVDVGIDEAKAARNGEPQGKNQVTVFQAFDQYVDDHGRPTPFGTGFPESGSVKAVDDAAFQEFAAGKMGHPESKYRLRAVREALDARIERRMYCRNGGLLWKM